MPNTTPSAQAVGERSSRAPGLPEPATLNRPASSVPIDGGPSNPIGAGAAQNDPR